MLKLLTLVSIFYFSLSARAITIDATDSGALATVLKQKYDVVVVGGGTAGLALASRLSDKKSVKVLCLEAGAQVTDNQGINIPGLSSTTFFSSVDWAYFTVPQLHANLTEVYLPEGKVLGGSSALNFMFYTRGHARESDVWGSLIGDQSWSWKSILPFYKKSEKFHPSTGNNLNATIFDTPSVHGHSGPIDTSFSPYLAPQYLAYEEALLAEGIPIMDANSGQNSGVGMVPSAINPKDNNRVTSATGYYGPRASRSNLVVVTNAFAARIIWGSHSKKSATASGVAFIPAGTNTTQSVFLSKRGEVVVSAGAIQTPHFLELSGVGNPAVLEPLGIPTIVNLPGVGENFHDHPAAGIIFELAPGLESYDGLTTNATRLTEWLAEFAKGEGPLTSYVWPSAMLPAQTILSSTDLAHARKLFVTPTTGTPASPPISKSQLAHSLQLFKESIPFLEVVGFNGYFGAGAQPGKQYFSIITSLQHPLSRGSVHTTSSSPLTPPAIDPNHLQAYFDKFMLAKAVKFARNVAANSKLAPFLGVEVLPGASVQTDADFENYVFTSTSSEYHLVGSASMLPRADGGVVDSKLKVYGTTNVRVADTSVVPFHQSTHTQSVAYAVAEKAAAIIGALF